LCHVRSSEFTQTGVGCCGYDYIYDENTGEYEEICNCEYPTGIYSEMSEIYTLPGYSATNLRSTNIQQLSNPYPNPAKTYILLPYSLPQGVNEDTIRVFNAHC